MVEPWPSPGQLGWSIRAFDIRTGETLLDEHADRRMRTASIGKLLLLAVVARGISTGTLDPAERLSRRQVNAVADSGIWQHLSIESLTIADLAALVGMASDNLATNVLLRRVGLTSVTAIRSELGLIRTALLDEVRDIRRVDHPWTLSTGSAAELAGMLRGLGRGELFDAATSEQLLSWLQNGLDLSMVAAGWGLDPLAHQHPDRGLRLQHKTGTDDGVRCDVGLLHGPARTIAYAVLANWDPAGPDLRDDALGRMRSIGSALRRMLG